MARDIKVEAASGNRIRMYGVCDVTGDGYSVTVDHAAWKAWKNGALIQNCMPNLTDVQREFLISEMTPAEWSRMETEIDEYY